MTLRGTGLGERHPTSLGKYEIVQVLGEGGMGVVYKAYDALIDRYVAAKVIRKDLLGDLTGEIARRFRNEAVAVGRISHPNIVAVYDYGEDDQRTYIIMEYAPGETLETLLARRELTPQPSIVALMSQLLDGLHFAHERGIVHRDIKPSNLIVDPEGRLKIADFGIARVNASNLTQAGATIGTPSYMAPEQVRGGDVDRRADVFSAGIVFYQMCTGRRPFDGTTLEELAYKICHVDAAPPSSVHRALPPGVDGIASRALAKDREQRFATAAEFARAVQAGFQVASRSDTVPLSAGVLPPSVSEIRPGASIDVERVSRALAIHVGPIARVLVSRAVSGARDLPDLCAKLETQLGSDDERARFRRDAGMR